MDGEVSIGIDLRIIYRRMVRQTDEIYRKRKSEVGPEGEYPDVQAWNLAKAANSVLTQVKRGSYKDWTLMVNEALEKMWKSFGAESKLLKSSDLEERFIRMALKDMPKDDMRTLTSFAGEVLGSAWRVDMLYREFIAIAGELETMEER